MESAEPPRGPQNSDESPKTAAEVARALGATGQFTRHKVRVSSSNGVVRLEGRVDSYYKKQVAQAAALKVVGAGRLVNDVEVGPGN